MSILSVLTMLSNQTNTGYSLGSASTTGLTDAAQKAIDAAKAKVAAAGQSQSGVSISAAAQAAAAEKADGKKDFGTLAKEVRTKLDSQSASGTASKPDMSSITGRAVAAVASNKDGLFSKGEIAAAKSELRERTRSAFVSAASSASGLAGLAAYNKQVISSYDAMSVEERTVRGWTSQTRIGAAAFVQTASAIETA